MVVRSDNREVLDYDVVDVFTDVAFAGNPLAVVHGADSLSTEQLQQLAREFHLSETAFPMLADEEARRLGAHYRLRIFTPEVELPFAGHPSVGTAWLMASSQRVPPDDGVVRQLCGEGLLPLSVADTGATLTGGRPVLGPPTDTAPLLAAAGLGTPDLVEPTVWPARVCSTGIGYAMLRVTPGALDRCEPDLTLLRRGLRHPHDATGLYVVAWDDLRDGIDARMFAGDLGVPEDPATGSAALALGVYLAGGPALPDGGSVTVRQGVAMGRPSRLDVTVDAVAGSVRRVRVSGGVVPVARGQVAVPLLDG
jgi:trans-2,3-dihydro-3-hydroxyanthranilate isomerase